MLIVKTTDGIKQSTLAEAKTNFNHFKGWYCGAGMDFLWINSRGKVFGNVCRHSGMYGNVFEGFTLPSEPMICPATSCYCASDINILKSKNKQHFESLKPYVDYSLPKYNNEEILAVESSNQVFAINWNIGKRCNFDCSYCPADVHDNFSPHITIDTFKAAFNNLYKQIPKEKKIKITFTGGEPTINPDYYDIVDYAVQHNAEVVTNTNGTGSINKLKRLMHAGGLHVSVHTEYVQPEKLANKIKKLSTITPGFLILKYMLVPGKLEECKSFIDKLPPSQGGYRISVEPLVDKANNNKILDYTDEELTYLKAPK